MRKISIIISSLLLMLITFTKVNSDEKFSSWIIEFKKKAINEGISEKTVDAVMNNAIFLPKVIEYDRYQPEFYEDTKTYVSKRTSKDKVKKGKRIYKKNKNLINIVDKEFKVEKELLLALMGIETNYGTYLGKMDIISSLATLSYDKRRSEFFSNELITILKLIDQNKVDKDILFGSWAGAFGNFQFMPTTISNYAIDYNNNSIIELKEAEDSFASAANYLNKIGWRKNEPCFFQIDLNENIPKNLNEIVFGAGCFWGVERKFWDLDGVYVTSVGYSGGNSENPSYEDVCYRNTNHVEVVKVHYDSNEIKLDEILKVFWECHDPTQGMRQGNDIGTQYRSVIFCSNEDDIKQAVKSKEKFQNILRENKFGDITTEISLIKNYYLAEEYHQQYLAKHPNGYCGLGGTGCTLD